MVERSDRFPDRDGIAPPNAIKNDQGGYVLNDQNGYVLSYLAEASTGEPEDDAAAKWLTFSDGQEITLDGRRLWLGPHPDTGVSGLYIESDVHNYDSTAWTGLEARMAAQPAIVTQIAEQIQSLDKLVEQAGLTNLEQARAKAITSALMCLVQSPQPEWKPIVELLTSPVFTAIANAAGLIGLIISLMGLSH